MKKKPHIDFREDTGVKNVLMNITDVHHRHSGKPQRRMAVVHPFLLSIAGSLSEPYSLSLYIRSKKKKKKKGAFSLTQNLLYAFIAF